MIPRELYWLFWDADPARVGLATHPDYVLERIMSRGDWVAMRWLLRESTPAMRAEFLVRRGARLAPRERAFWSFASGLASDAGPGGGRPPWAG